MAAKPMGPAAMAVHKPPPNRDPQPAIEPVCFDGDPSAGHRTEETLPYCGVNGSSSGTIMLRCGKI